MQTVYHLESAFRRAIGRHKAPHQSGGVNVRFPGSSIAAADLGVSRQHLHRVLIGERQSTTLLAKWNAWLKRHPEFARLNRKPAH